MSTPDLGPSVHAHTSAAPSALTDGRLGVGPSPTLVTHVNAVELSDELDGIVDYVHMDIAHALMLTQRGIFEPARGRALVEALLSLLDGDTEQLLAPDPRVGTLGLQIERYLEGALGEAGLDIQRGRSRIDQKATGWRMTNRAAILDVMSALERLASSILSVAARHDGVLIPGYTHLQHSQPTTLDHYLNAHYWAVSRNLERLVEVAARLNLSPLGGAAYSGTSWDIDRDTTAAYLGFDRPIVNARDAGMASIDLGAELTSVLGLTLSSVSRLASDLNYWASSEVGLVQIDASLCGTSSMMPQKRNPMVLERIRGLAGSAAGWSASQLGVMHTSTSTDVDQAYVHNVIPGYCAETAGVIDLLRETLETVEVDRDGMRASARKHWSTASALADRLVDDHGLSFRHAHDAVARFIAAHIDAEVPDGEVRTALADGALAEYSTEQLLEILDPESFVASRTSAGGTSVANRLLLAAEADDDLERHRERISALRTVVQTGKHRLLSDARALIGSP